MTTIFMIVSFVLGRGISKAIGLVYSMGRHSEQSACAAWEHLARAEKPVRNYSTLGAV
ncbi:MAG TPA: hypothetical protein VFW25_06655 [Silvibacterium sp.]|nr:hypothetical protein [Silvibacterium sp.]